MAAVTAAAENSPLSMEELVKRFYLLEAIVATQSEKLVELERSKSALSATVVNEPAERPKVPSETFTVGGKTYKFLVAGVQFGGKRYLATEALEDEKLLATIVAEYPNCVTTV